MSDDATEQASPGQETIASPFALVFWTPEGPSIVRLPPGPAVIGRGEPSDLVIADPTLSRQHARVRPFGGGVHVEDAGSKNGLHVRGRRVASAELFPGDTFELGDLRVSLTSLSRVRQGPTASAAQSVLDRLELELAAARHFARPLAVAVLDAGARADEVSARLRATLRPVDACGPYGAGLVLVLFAQGDVALATRMLEPALGAGARAGIASVPPLEPSGHVVLEHARAALGSARAGHAVVAREAPREDEPLVVASPQMRAVLAQLGRWAPSALPVLVLGETGTGKELVAREVHRQSGRSGPFRAVNCGAIPETLVESTLFGHVRGAFTGAHADRKGLFEEAPRGTVFLDEIGELPLPAQAALLRVLDQGRLVRVGSVDERTVDARVVAATHRDLEAMAREGRFRSDLLYRLNALSVTLPALRERPEDVLALADRFLRRAADAAGRPGLRLDGVATQALLDYEWPGNVRELRNAIDRAVLVASGPVVSTEDLPERVALAARSSLEPAEDDALDDAASEPEPPEDGAPHVSTEEPTGSVGPLRERLREYETRLLLRALERAGGNQGVAARALGLPKRTLVYKLSRLGVRRRARYESSDE